MPPASLRRRSTDVSTKKKARPGTAGLAKLALGKRRNSSVKGRVELDDLDIGACEGASELAEDMGVGGMGGFEAEEEVEEEVDAGAGPEDLQGAAAVLSTCCSKHYVQKSQPSLNGQAKWELRPRQDSRNGIEFLIRLVITNANKQMAVDCVRCVQDEPLHMAKYGTVFELAQTRWAEEWAPHE